ncbi:MAG: FtsB family cell division protein [Clostridia bacterium]|jgi:cell division protein FtsB
MARTRWRMKPRLKILIFTAIFLYVGMVLVQQEFKMREQRQEKAALLQKIEETREINEELRYKLEYMETDEYVEKAARERLGWIKKGEIKFVEKKE